MKREITSIVGLREVKVQLEKIVDKIISAEHDASYSFRVVPPKPFHMVFIGNAGTGIVYKNLIDSHLNSSIRMIIGFSGF